MSIEKHFPKFAQLLRMPQGVSGGLILAILGAVFFSTKPILIKLVYAYDVESITLLMYRMAFAVPVYIVVGFWVYWRKREQSIPLSAVIYAVLLGSIGYYGASLFDLYGLKLISTQLGRMILFTYPTLVTLFGWLIYSYPVTRYTFLALFVSYAGVSLIFLQDMQSYGEAVLIGSGWVMLSAICFSFFLLLSKKPITVLGSRLFTCIAMTSSAFFVLIHFLLEGGLSMPMPHPDAMLLIFGISILSTVIPTFLIAAAIAKIGPSNTSIVGSFGPAVTAVLAVWLLGEAFTIYHFIGMLLVILAITLMPKNSEG